MRRLAVVLIALMLLPASPAVATELDELLNNSLGASYSGEQTISCSTPDGVRDSIVRVTQTGGDIKVSSAVTDDVELAVGDGTWSLTRGGGLVAEAAVGSGDKKKTEPLYTVADEIPVEYLDRPAMSYLLVRSGEPRAELVFDDETGALVEVVTFTTGGDVYCERRFVSLEAGPMNQESLAAISGGTAPVEDEVESLPEEVAGFELFDHYEDEEGLEFSYYSDGFFSFALFETPLPVEVPDATEVELGSGMYRRSFGAGQVTYVWETQAGGMALVGDLPPDLHESVLAKMPPPQDPGFFRRVWRTLFG